MTITALDSYSFAFDEFVFGGADSPYQILAVEGLEDLPSIRNQDDNRGYQDGMFTGRDFLSGRTITVTIQITGNNTSSMQQNVALMQAALKPQQSGVGLLQFQIPGFDLQQVGARVRRRALRIDPNYTYGLSTAVYEFFCPDPRRYNNLLQQTDLINATSVAGRTYNRVYTALPSPGANPFINGMSFGGGSNSANLVTNNGWVTTYPTIRMTGTAINPKVTNVTTGDFLLFNVTLGTGDVLFVDTNLRSVTLNGISRRAILDNSSTWFGADPGTSYYTFIATGTDANTTCQVSWRSAYI